MFVWADGWGREGRIQVVLLGCVAAVEIAMLVEGNGSRETKGAAVDPRCL